VKSWRRVIIIDKNEGSQVEMEDGERAGENELVQNESCLTVSLRAN
jgi:hypothetical protein